MIFGNDLDLPPLPQQDNIPVVINSPDLGIPH